MYEAKAFKTFIRIYSALKSERLRYVKLSLHKAIISSVMAHSCPACEIGADT
jgi:hypothetical protein